MWICLVNVCLPEADLLTGEIIPGNGDAKSIYYLDVFLKDKEIDLACWS